MDTSKVIITTQKTIAKQFSFEYEVEVLSEIQKTKKSKGIDIKLIYIPNDIFDWRLSEDPSIIFEEASLFNFSTETDNKFIAISLTNY